MLKLLKKKAGVGALYCLVQTCKYKENDVKSKCILNILNFWSWVVKKLREKSDKKTPKYL